MPAKRTGTGIAKSDRPSSSAYYPPTDEDLEKARKKLFAFPSSGSALIKMIKQQRDIINDFAHPDDWLKMCAGVKDFPHGTITISTRYPCELCKAQAMVRHLRPAVVHTAAGEDRFMETCQEALSAMSRDGLINPFAIDHNKE